MTKLFMTVLNMSITGTFVILALFILRLLMKRLPRIYSYLLWSVVLLRLICPFAIEADFGIIPSIRIGEERMREKAPERRILQADAVFAEQWEIYDEGVLTYGEQKESSAKAEAPVAYQGITVTVLHIVGIIWLAGAVLLLSYGVYSYRKLRKKLCGLSEQAIERKETGYRMVVSDKIDTPFTAGFLRPTMYLPDGLGAQNREMVIAHEKTHIRRKDYLAKTAAYFVTCVHWFNPFVWLAFHLMEEGMETSCDEAVLQEVGYDRKKMYAKALLSFASGCPIEIGKCPLAFGGNHMKKRIKNAVKAKKVKAWMTAGAVVLVAGMVILLSVNGTKTSNAAVPTVTEAPEVAITQAPTPEQVPETVVTQAPTPEQEPEITQAPEVTEPILIPESEDVQEPDEEAVSGDGAEAENDMAAEPLTDASSILLINLDGNYNDAEILYTIPVPEGSYRITSSYGKRVHPITGAVLEHNGIDFAAEEGTAIGAAADGWVYETGYHSYCGNYVIICHDNGEVTYYSHCSEILVEDGQSVSRSETIARVGSTGASTGPHLHFAVSYGGEYIQPVFEKVEE